MIQKPRPSALPHLEACPRWVGRPDRPDEEKDAMDEAADEGTLVHAKMEHLARVPQDQWEATIEADPDLSPDLRQVVKECAEQVRDLFVFGLPVTTKENSGLGLGPGDRYELTRAEDGIYCECGVDSGVASPGTADLVLLQGNRAVLVDYKTNRVLRAHDLQQTAYVLGVFKVAPQVDSVENRIVAPRLGVEAHPPVTYTRDQIPELQKTVEDIVAKSQDPFEPGAPGTQCAFCAGNGRCPWQAAALRDIPVDAAALVASDTWREVLIPETPEVRGRRRELIKWLGGFVQAVKDDDKQWAIDNPDVELPGWTKTVSLGRASLDTTRLGEVNAALSLTFGIGYDTLVSFLKPDKVKLIEFISMMRGTSVDEAKREVAKVMAPFDKRGAPIISFRAKKKERKVLKNHKD